jgi:hypothetical protein
MNRISSIIIVGVLVSAAVAGKAAAQWNVARFGTERQRVFTTFGFDPALVTTVGYGRVVQVTGHDVQWTGDVGVVAAKMDAHDFRARLSMQTSLVQWRSVHLTGSATAITRGTENAIYRGINFGADLSSSVGVYRQRWFAAGEFGFDKAVITHVRHSNYYRTYFYPDAKDGWYLDTGGTYHGGVAGGLSLGRSEVVARVGLLRTERFNELMPPMYASVGVGVGF